MFYDSKTNGIETKTKITLKYGIPSLLGVPGVSGNKN